MATGARCDPSGFRPEGDRLIDVVSWAGRLQTRSKPSSEASGGLWTGAGHRIVRSDRQGGDTAVQAVILATPRSAPSAKMRRTGEALGRIAFDQTLSATFANLSFQARTDPENLGRGGDRTDPDHGRPVADRATSVTTSLG